MSPASDVTRVTERSSTNKRGKSLLCNIVELDTSRSSLHTAEEQTRVIEESC